MNGVAISRFTTRGLILLVCLGLTGCGLLGKDGKYYQDDGPPRFKKGPNPAKVPDAVPRSEPLSRTGNKPYTALGQRFVPLKSSVGYSEQGYASWYGRKYHGRRTSSGETYDMYKMTAAHPTLPLPSYVRVVNLDNKRQTVVRVNDRGPFLNNRVIDLSYMAARKLGVVATGTARVLVEAVHAGGEPANRTEPRKERVSQLGSAAAAGGGFVVQVGSFASEVNAARLRSRLLQGGYTEVAVHQVTIAEKIYHRVQLGPFEAEASARRMAGDLESFLNSPVSVLRFSG